jgi:arsenite methyltransferase
MSLNNQAERKRLMRSEADKLQQAVLKSYSAAAEDPQGKHPFPLGRQFALEVGYPAEILDDMPRIAVDAFTGVSSVAIFASLFAGARVLDLGCGAGLDSLIAARRVGPDGFVVGIDFSRAMLARASRAAAEVTAENTGFCCAEAERLPLQDATVDVALVNGIFNLNPDRERILHELARVLRPGGTLFAAELILREPLSAQERADPRNWFA